jgi:hypothetical protein
MGTSTLESIRCWSPSEVRKFEIAMHHLAIAQRVRRSCAIWPGDYARRPFTSYWLLNIVTGCVDFGPLRAQNFGRSTYSPRRSNDERSISRLTLSRGEIHGLIFLLRFSRLGFCEPRKLTVRCDRVCNIGDNRVRKDAEVPFNSKDRSGTTGRNTVAAGIAVVRLNG